MYQKPLNAFEFAKNKLAFAQRIVDILFLTKGAAITKDVVITRVPRKGGSEE